MHGVLLSAAVGACDQNISHSGCLWRTSLPIDWEPRSRSAPAFRVDRWLWLSITPALPGVPAPDPLSGNFDRKGAEHQYEKDEVEKSAQHPRWEP